MQFSFLLSIIFKFISNTVGMYLFAFDPDNPVKKKKKLIIILYRNELYILYIILAGFALYAGLSNQTNLESNKINRRI